MKTHHMHIVAKVGCVLESTFLVLTPGLQFGKGLTIDIVTIPKIPNHSLSK